MSDPLAIAARQAANLEAQSAKQILSYLQGMTIQDQDQCRQIDQITKQAKVLEKELEKREKAITVPMNASLKAVRDDFRPARETYKAIEEAGKNLIAIYLETAKQTRDRVYAEGVQALQEARPEAQELLTRAALATEAEAPQGTSLRYAWEATIDDPRLVPRELCTPDPKLIRIYLSQFPVEKAAPEIPGLCIARKPIVSMRTE